MKKIKKVGCMILVVVLMTVSISTTQVDASIASEAKNIEIGQKLTATFGNGETISYKFVLSKKSTITLSGYFKSNYDQNITLYKKNGYKIWSDSTSAGDWTENEVIDKWRLKKTITLAKGTYYIAVYNHSGRGFTYSLNTSSKEVKSVSKMSIKLKKGRSLSLGSIIDLDGKITWSSANKKVVSVTSKGKIKGLKKGKTVITAYSKSQKKKILVTVNVK